LTTKPVRIPPAEAPIHQTVVTGPQMSLFDLPVYRKDEFRRQARLAVRHRHRQRARFGPLQSLLAPAGASTNMNLPAA